MAALPDPSALELAALIAKRLIHDAISPVGAINNGLELIDEDKTDDETRVMAMELIHSSAATARARLEFGRLAFGAAGSDVDTGDAEAVARKLIATERKFQIEWDGARVYMATNKVKLLLNLVSIGMGAIPFGGTIAVRIEDGAGPNPVLTVRASGRSPRVPTAFRELLEGTRTEPIEPHDVLALYTLKLAEAAQMTVTATLEEGQAVVLSARSSQAVAP